jgi:Rrf2 family protein
MRLSPAAELAVRGVLVLAEHHGEGPVALKTICSARDLPKQYLVKLFALLAKADIVTPVRGKGGGFVMARDPRSITLLEVIEAVEGPIALNFCQHVPPKCDAVGCSIRKVWGELQDTFKRKLNAITIRECLAGGPKAKAAARQTAS